jgi:hypothetical protein
VSFRQRLLGKFASCATGCPENQYVHSCIPFCPLLGSESRATLRPKQARSQRFTRLTRCTLLRASTAQPRAPVPSSTGTGRH